jgi:general secretion pathway protein H
MARPVVKARTPTLAPGNKRLGPAGFSLVELLVVLLLIALASGLVSVALRDGSEARLEQEAQRLAALLEAGRAQSRASGVMVRFELLAPGSSPGQDGQGDNSFRFVGLPPEALPPGHWLVPQVQARILSARALVLGPEPLIGAQSIELRLDNKVARLTTDGIAPFVVAPIAEATP